MSIQKGDILKYLANALFKSGQSMRAYKILTEYVILMKDEETFFNYLLDYNGRNENVDNATEDNVNSEVAPVDKNPSSDIYRSLCNGEQIEVRQNVYN